MYLQPGHAGCVTSTIFFNGALIRTLGTGAFLTVANNARGDLLAKLTICMVNICSHFVYEMEHKPFTWEERDTNIIMFMYCNLFHN